MGKNNDGKIISALLSTTTVREAAEAVGVSERTVYNRLKDAEFSKQFAKARREVWKGNVGTLQSLVGKAIQTIAEIMEDEKTPPQVRLNASAEIIRSGIKMTEIVDVVDRLEALEQIMEETE